MRRCLPRFFRFNFEMYEEITFGFSFLLTNLPTFFFFNDPATTKISTLPLHDALPIYMGIGRLAGHIRVVEQGCGRQRKIAPPPRELLEAPAPSGRPRRPTNFNDDLIEQERGRERA